MNNVRFLIPIGVVGSSLVAVFGVKSYQKARSKDVSSEETTLNYDHKSVFSTAKNENKEVTRSSPALVGQDVSSQREAPTVTQRISFSDKDLCPKWDRNWDFREFDVESKPVGAQDAKENKKGQISVFSQPRLVFLVRHGQYNMDGFGDDEHYLTPLGLEQAQLTGERINAYIQSYMAKVRSRVAKSDKVSDQPEGPSNRIVFPIRVTTSTMLRAKQTGQTIFDQIQTSIPESELDECGATASAVMNAEKQLNVCSLICEGPPIMPDPPIDPSIYNPDPWEYSIEGARIEAGFRKHIHRLSKMDQDVYTQSHNGESAFCIAPIEVIVCHGNVIRYFVARALQLNPAIWLRLSIAHASITALNIRNSASGRVSIGKYSEVGHLPAEKVTFS